ncbi:MAG: phosphoribosylamine--glycine ligase [Desulfurococcaceae archaeon]
MRVLIIGSGAREHAIAKLVLKSTHPVRIYSLSDYANPGLKRVCEITGGVVFLGKTTSPYAALKAAEESSPDLIVVGPEEPQFSGVVDALKDRGFAVFGATKNLARIEQNKVYARSFMWKHNIPGRLFFQAFKSLEEAEEFMKFSGDVVVKPARQVGGKGVRVLKDTKAYLNKSEVKLSATGSIMREIERYEDIEYKILVEQRVEGVEYTVHLITDGTAYVALPAIQDHPHAYDHDIGPETGGMGCIAGPGWVPPFLTMEEFKRSVSIVGEVLGKLAEEVSEAYTGVLAGQMMLTWVWGPTIIEFYSRFGDPEISALLPILKSDFLEVLEKAASRKLSSVKLEIDESRVAVVKAIAPVGYPVDRHSAQGHPVTVNEAGIAEQGCDVVYGSVSLENGKLITMGSRIVEVICGDESYEKAYIKSENSMQFVNTLDGWPLFHRSDIGSPELVQRRMQVAERTRRVYKYREERGLLGKLYVWLPSKGLVSNPLIMLMGGYHEP